MYLIKICYVFFCQLCATADEGSWAKTSHITFLHFIYNIANEIVQCCLGSEQKKWSFLSAQRCIQNLPIFFLLCLKCFGKQPFGINQSQGKESLSTITIILTYIHTCTYPIRLAVPLSLCLRYVAKCFPLGTSQFIFRSSVTSVCGEKWKTLIWREGERENREYSRIYSMR